MKIAFGCYHEPENSVEFDCLNEDIPTDEEINHVIQVARENGIRTLLKPQTASNVDHALHRSTMICCTHRKNTGLVSNLLQPGQLTCRNLFFH